ncbi:MAG: cytochrome c-type biogenesis protein [Bacillota bacterium]
MVLRKLPFIFVFTISALLFFFGQAQAAIYDDIQESLICPACMDDRMTVATCTDSTAERTRQDIKQKLALGQTKDEIINGYVSDYGEVILAVPRQNGFGLVAWIMPPLALVGAGLIVVSVLKGWVRNSSNSKQISKKSGVHIDSVDEERINEEIRKYL